MKNRWQIDESAKKNVDDSHWEVHDKKWPWSAWHVWTTLLNICVWRKNCLTLSKRSIYKNWNWFCLNFSWFSHFVTLFLHVSVVAIVVVIVTVVPCRSMGSSKKVSTIFQVTAFRQTWLFFGCFDSRGGGLANHQHAKNCESLRVQGLKHDLIIGFYPREGRYPVQVHAHWLYLRNLFRHLSGLAAFCRARRQNKQTNGRTNTWETQCARKKRASEQARPGARQPFQCVKSRTTCN